MNILVLLQQRLRPALAQLVADPQRLAELLAMIQPAQHSKFGDYQANFAMPLKKECGKAPQPIAADVGAAAQLSDLCQPPEIAGPGFINLRLRDDWLTEQLNAAV